MRNFFRKRARYHISHNVIDKNVSVNYFTTVELKSRARKLLPSQTPPTACWEFYSAKTNK